MLEVAEAMKRAGVELAVKDDEWCAVRAREATNAEDREILLGGIRRQAEAEDAEDADMDSTDATDAEEIE